MPNINKIKLSGTSYDIQDLNAPSVSSVTQAQYDSLPESAKTSNTLFIITDAEAGDLSQYWTSAQTNSAITQAVSGKQDTLVSGTNIKTINNTSILGSGNIDVGTNLPISAGTGTNSLIFNNASNKASGGCSHAEGGNTQANEWYTHAEGVGTRANGYYSHAEGIQTVASGNSSHAEGSNTVANNESEHASGRYNVSNTGSTDADKTLFSVGNGTSTSARHNAFELRRNGDIFIVSGGTDIKLQDHLGGGGITSGEVQTMIDESISGKADSSSLATVATTGDYNDLTNKPTIPTVPTSNSAFTNDAGYVTSGDVQSQINGSISGKANIEDAIGVEYLQSTDGYQYINLGYVPSGTGVEIGGDVAIISYPSTAQWMTTAWIAYSGEQYESFRLIRRANEDNILYANHHTKASGQGQQIPFVFGQKYTFKFTDSEYQWGEDTYTNSGTTGTTNTGQIRLFGNGSAIGAISRIYSFYIKKDGQYVMDLIPVAKKGVGYMYDKISGQYFGNDGTGSFTLPNSLGGLSLVKLTQAEYDALSNKDSNTLYVIVN